MNRRRNKGFTLVELLVVIVIVAVLATLSATLGPRMIKRGRQAKSVTDMKQMAVLLTGFAGDNANRLPAPRVIPTGDDTETLESYWHVRLEQEISGQSLQTLSTDRYWKESKSIFVNPLWPKKSVTHLTPGYGMNIKVVQNVASNKGESLGTQEAETTGINLATISEPHRVPIIMPSWAYTYTCEQGQVKDKRWEQFQVSKNVPVLFIDGHTELMPPSEYVRRDLDKMPLAE